MIVAGFGFRSEATEASFHDALRLASSGTPIDAVATLEDKMQSQQFKAFTISSRKNVIAISAFSAERQPTLSLSEASLAARGTGSVAEATALAALAPGARLLAPRAISSDRMATCALAIGDPA